MTCATCEKVRWFVRNGAGQLVQRLAPFVVIEYQGYTIVTTRDGNVVAANGGAVYPGDNVTMVNPDYMRVEFQYGQAMGAPVDSMRLSFSNPLNS